MSVAVRHFGEDYAKRVAGRQWSSDRKRCEGILKEKVGADAWKVSFPDMAEPVTLKRKLLELERRGARPGPADGSRTAPREAEGDSSDEEGGAEPEQGAQAAMHDSSDGSDLSEDEAQAGTGEDVDGWTRADEHAFDERARHGFTAKPAPSFNMPNYQQASLFSIVCFWLCAKSKDAATGQEQSFLGLMAETMQRRGREKAADDADRWAKWTVNHKDVLQWIGTWYYMLTFPQIGPRESYFTVPPVGPSHGLCNILALGENGHKGRRWFESMHASFALPVGDTPASDPFQPVRFMWDVYRDHFTACVTASWLITLDESMVKWLGRAMPGLMVVPRKPTPIGAELHTLACAVCGILVYFELYEGKERMAVKQYCDKYSKSVALTLRCVKPFLGSVMDYLSA